jgi:DGQHR domain-containing protein
MNQTVRSISVRAIRLAQPIGEFYLASFPCRKLCDISSADIRRLDTERGFETYLGIQRPLNPARVKELKEYVLTADATFPTSIIIAVDRRCAEWDETNSTLHLTEYYSQLDGEDSIPYEKIANILDGQHRIAGLADFHTLEFDLNVAVFVDIDIAEQALIFSTVNLTQTKVNRSLVYDLFELAKSRSPQKTCHSIAVALDAASESPFYKRIKRLGAATRGRTSETLTQAAFVEALLPYISRNARQDRDRLIRKLGIDGTPTEHTPLRGLFASDRDAEITKILWNYFAAVEERWPKAWGGISPGNMLNKTNGFLALMRLFGPAYVRLASTLGERVPLARFSELFANVSLQDADFHVERFKPGTSGQVALFKELLQQTGLKD